MLQNKLLTFYFVSFWILSVTVIRTCIHWVEVPICSTLENLSVFTTGPSHPWPTAGAQEGSHSVSHGECWEHPHPHMHSTLSEKMWEKWALPPSPPQCVLRLYQVINEKGKWWHHKPVSWTVDAAYWQRKGECWDGEMGTCDQHWHSRTGFRSIILPNPRICNCISEESLQRTYKCNPKLSRMIAFLKWVMLSLSHR